MDSSRRGPLSAHELQSAIQQGRIYLRSRGLERLPPEVLEFSSLESLDLSLNHLTALPPEIGQLASHRTLSLSGNQLTTLPPEIGQLINLQELDLSDNHLTELPPEIGQLSSLVTLRLPRNQLNALPPEISQLTRLQSLDLRGNPLTGLPPEIGQLTSLTLELEDSQLTVLAFIPEEDRPPLGARSQEGDPPTMDQAVQDLLDQRSRTAETKKEERDTRDKDLLKVEKDAGDSAKWDLEKGGADKSLDWGGDDDDAGDDDDDDDDWVGSDAGASVDSGSDEREVYPRIEAPGVVVAGQEFVLTVGIGPAATAGVAGGPFAVSRQPFILVAQIIADGFNLAPGQLWRQELTATEEEPFPSVVLRLVAQPQDDRVRASQIQVVYGIGGRVVGLGVRAIAVISSPELLDGVTVEPEDEVTAIRVAQGEPVADLTVSITFGDVPGRLLWTYQSPHLDPPDEPESCDLGADARDFAQMLIRRVHQREGRADLDPFLRGTGMQIADKMPDSFWSMLADVAAVRSPQRPTVLLQSAEPYVPWELALVPEPLDPALPPYLGCQVVTGRWVLARRKPKLPPPPGGEADTMTVVSGEYNLARWPRLPHAEEEARILQDTYAARLVNADLDSVLGFLRAGPLADLVHFAVHGSADPSGTENGIILVDGSALDPTVVQSFSLQGEPFVFLNACQLGTGQEMLGDYGGMAQAFLYADACGVVAPLWSVNDDVAEELVVDFYARAFDGERPAEVLRDLRCAAGSESGRTAATALAYQFFGHPSMTLDRRRLPSEPEAAQSGP